ncbi:LytR C-terminal domain-containing protein [Streptomyces sp. NPDC003077]|uniref:LytR C-terminal domain-containing protein n=1 Tax=Streptomyces sp. NPDC003077 TaxID=3154443 RepID=UPI0033AAF742
MSMLTPPGMGGKKYRVTGDRYPRLRRPRHRRRIVLAIVGAVCALALAGWGTLQLIDVFDGKESAPRASHKKECRQVAGGNAARPATVRPLPRPADITVNVLNATPRGGLAKATADELRKRGFKVGKVGNAPAALDKKVKGTGVLLGPAAAREGALKVLGTQLAGAEPRTDGHAGADIDLIIGDTFKELVKRPDADKALAALNRPASPAPSPTC